MEQLRKGQKENGTKDGPGESLTWREDRRGQVSREKHLQKAALSAFRKSPSSLRPDCHTPKRQKASRASFFFGGGVYFSATVPVRTQLCLRADVPGRSISRKSCQYFRSATGKTCKTGRGPQTGLGTCISERTGFFFPRSPVYFRGVVVATCATHRPLREEQ